MKNNILKTASIIITFCFFFFNTNTSFATELRTLSFTEQPATNYNTPWYEENLPIQYAYNSNITLGNGWCNGPSGIILMGNSAIEIDLHSLSGISRIQVLGCDNNAGTGMQVFVDNTATATVNYSLGGMNYLNTQNEPTKAQLNTDIENGNRVV